MFPLLLFLLALPAASTAAPSESRPEIRTNPNRLAMPNALGETPPGCIPVPQQVAGEDRDYPGTRLDQQPPGKLLHAVERQVNGCREVTFVAEERQRATLRR